VTVLKRGTLFKGLRVECLGSSLGPSKAGMINYCTQIKYRRLNIEHCDGKSVCQLGE
jgi:hypothetical protein